MTPGALRNGLVSSLQNSSRDDSFIDSNIDNDSDLEIIENEPSKTTPTVRASQPKFDRADVMPHSTVASSPTKTTHKRVRTRKPAETKPIPLSAVFSAVEMVNGTEMH